MVRPLGVILAGGLARRMGGGDKSLLSLGASSRVLDQVIARLG
ncbi:MAG: molybdenum cofactor guanylyltransferase MobA, partial [Proteobacteria bacterium]